MLADDEKWFRVSLRLMGDTIPIDEIERMLEIAPSSIGRKGEHLQGNPKRAKYETHIWVWSFPAEPSVPFETQIADLLERLEPKKDALLEILALPKTEGELFLGFSSGNGQGGANFPANLLQRVANCGLSICLDLYPPTIDETEQA